MINEAVCKRAQLECTIVAQDWDSQIPSLLSGKFDVVLTMARTKSAAKSSTFP
uniref:transporter substrate-binding domain-containing protein n=1 Tax=Thauera sp. SDU_THAU2 TaxID=3136633 RepID=UPI00311EE9EA